MIRVQTYFISVFIASSLLALILAMNSNNFLFLFMFYVAIIFMLGISITVFPFVYYNHFSELRILGKIPKYTPDQIINIKDADRKFNVSILDKNFEVVPGLIHEKYIDAKSVFIGHYIEFYQYASPYVLSYFPFLRIDSKSIIKLGQKKNIYSIENTDIGSLIKCNYFEIYTSDNVYKLIVLEESTDRFIRSIITSMQIQF
ncbi:hypothetical protein [Ferroplasma sp.]|uniref:hypothetical protein n=1 Tax=Ferroplasma sp. TaxID=2591003 RepID=UPI00307F1A22